MNLSKKTPKRIGKFGDSHQSYHTAYTEAKRSMVINITRKSSLRHLTMRTDHCDPAGVRIPAASALFLVLTPPSEPNPIS